MSTVADAMGGAMASLQAFDAAGLEMPLPQSMLHRPPPDGGQPTHLQR